MNETSVRSGWDTGDWSGLPPVRIHRYDPRRTERYEGARREIARALAGLDVQIEHIGSTAVAGLWARKGIDILIGLGEPADAETCAGRLQGIGFHYHFSNSEWTHLSGRGCKLHLTPLGSTFWSEHLLLRDYLRRHPEAVSAYQRLKQELAQKHGPDGRQYVEGKTGFVRSVVERARREGRPQGMAPSQTERGRSGHRGAV